MRTTNEIVQSALAARTVVPAFNIPYLPMMQPVVAALRDTGAFGLIQVARLEWEKFQARSLKAIRDEYEAAKDERYTRLHLDHVPVVDEDNQRVDYKAIIAEAIALGYQSVMVDGSRLSLDENIAATREVAAMAHKAGIPLEAELGAVLGHEAGPLPPTTSSSPPAKVLPIPTTPPVLCGSRAPTGSPWPSATCTARSRPLRKTRRRSRRG